MKDSGQIVRHDDGRIGRTFYHEGMVNGKIKVQWEKDAGERNFEGKPTLIDPGKLHQIGFIN